MSRAILVLLNSPGTGQSEMRRRLCRTLEQCRRASPDILILACISPGHTAEIRIALAPWLAAFPGEIIWLPPSGNDAGQNRENARSAVLSMMPAIRLTIVNADDPPPPLATFSAIWNSLDPGTSGLVAAGDEKNEPAVRRCVFFDRDGVVNRSPGPGYVLNPNQFVINEGIDEALRLIKAHDWLAILVTSQKGVGKRLMSQADLDEIHRHMQKTLAASGAAFDAIYAYTGTADCVHRPKPDPEMILSAAESFFIDLRQSWMIGDADRDIEMGKAAGLAGTIRIRGENPLLTHADYTLESVMEIPVLLKRILYF